MNNDKSKGLLMLYLDLLVLVKVLYVKRLLEKHDDLCISVSATTRSQENGEVDGVNYYFITKEKFIERIEQE